MDGHGKPTDPTMPVDQQEDDTATDPGTQSYIPPNIEWPYTAAQLEQIQLSMAIAAPPHSQQFTQFHATPLSLAPVQSTWQQPFVNPQMPSPQQLSQMTPSLALPRQPTWRQPFVNPPMPSPQQLSQMTPSFAHPHMPLPQQSLPNVPLPRQQVAAHRRGAAATEPKTEQQLIEEIRELKEENRKLKGSEEENRELKEENRKLKLNQQPHPGALSPPEKKRRLNQQPHPGALPPSENPEIDVLLEMKNCPPETTDTTVHTALQEWAQKYSLTIIKPRMMKRGRGSKWVFTGKIVARMQADAEQINLARNDKGSTFECTLGAEAHANLFLAHLSEVVTVKFDPIDF